ncbi:MAG: GIY-YIG nuclease family protein [FCB group bacterium]|nr:GIY-YIG nuclease family protein [FCB group bacterium]
MDKYYYVYILTNKNNNVLYTGVTSNLLKRVNEHRRKLVKGFTSNYNVNKLVYYEETQDIYGAIMREKQIKGYVRSKKIKLIKSKNPQWEDLFEKLVNGDFVSS